MLKEIILQVGERKRISIPSALSVEADLGGGRIDVREGRVKLRRGPTTDACSDSAVSEERRDMAVVVSKVHGKLAEAEGRET